MKLVIYYKPKTYLLVYNYNILFLNSILKINYYLLRSYLMKKKIYMNKISLWAMNICAVLSV